VIKIEFEYVGKISKKGNIYYVRIPASLKLMVQKYHRKKVLVKITVIDDEETKES